MSETKSARLNDLSPDEFRRLYDGFAIKDARIAELEAALRKTRPFVKVLQPTGDALARAQVALLERIDKLLSNELPPVSDTEP